MVNYWFYLYTAINQHSPNSFLFIMIIGIYCRFQLLRGGGQSYCQAREESLLGFASFLSLPGRSVLLPEKGLSS